MNVIEQEIETIKKVLYKGIVKELDNMHMSYALTRDKDNSSIRNISVRFKDEDYLFRLFEVSEGDNFGVEGVQEKRI